VASSNRRGWLRRGSAFAQIVYAPLRATLTMRDKLYAIFVLIINRGQEYMTKYDYIHGYTKRESLRLEDQANTLDDILHHDTIFPAG